LSDFIKSHVRRVDDPRLQQALGQPPYYSLLPEKLFRFANHVMVTAVVGTGMLAFSLLQAAPPFLEIGGEEKHAVIGRKCRTRSQEQTRDMGRATDCFASVGSGNSLRSHVQGGNQ
jgi:hypothetical protein